MKFQMKSVNMISSMQSVKINLLPAIIFLILMTIPVLTYAQWSGNTGPKKGETVQYSYTRTSTWGSSVQWIANFGLVQSQWLSQDKLTAYCTVVWNDVGDMTLTVKNGTTTISSLAIYVNCPDMYPPTILVMRLSDNAYTSIGCTNASFQINAGVGAGGTEVRWYNDITDTTPFQVGNSLTTGPLTASKTYYVNTFYFTSTGGGTSIASFSGAKGESMAMAPPGGGGGTEITCESNRIPVTITIQPAPIVTVMNEIPTVCSGNYDYISFMNSQGISGVVYNWTATYTSTFHTPVTSGTGNIQNTHLLAPGDNQNGTATYYITGTANGCTGPTATTSVTIFPRPDVNAASQEICSGQTTSIAISTSKNVAGTTFSWTASPANATGASGGSGTSINQTLTATTTSNGTVTYAITPTANGCTGTTINPVATVKPTPTVNVNNSLPSICSGDATSISMSTNGVAGTVLSWTVSQLNVSGAANGSGSSIIQNLSATSNIAGSAAYTVVPTANGCTGSSGNATVTVKPRPTVSASSQSICTGDATSIGITNPNGVAGTTFAWTVSQSNVTGASAGSGSTISQTLTNSSSTNGTATYTITPTASGCSGASTAPVATVKPRPVITLTNTAPSICSAQSTSITVNNNGILGAVYSWTATSTNVSGASSGSGTSVVQTLTTSIVAGGSVAYAFTSTANGCSGNSPSTSVTVKPKPTAVASGQTICSGTATSIAITESISIPSTTFTWSPTNIVSVSGYSSGSGASIAQTLNATTSSQGSLTYAITPSVNGCTGNVLNIIVLVNPTPTLPTIADVTTQTTAPVTLTATGIPAGEVVRWFDQASAGTLLATNPTYTSGTLSQPLTYFHASKRNTTTLCESARKQVLIVYSPPAVLAGDANVLTTGFYIYTFSGDASLVGSIWTATNGTTSADQTSPDGYTRTVRVRWTSPGPGRIELTQGSWIHAEKNVTVSCSYPGSPTSTSVSVDYGDGFVPATQGSCGPANFKLEAAPGVNGDAVMWYQTASGGTGIEGTSVTTGTISTSKPYFITTKNLTSGCETQTRLQLDATVRPIPSGTPVVAGNGRFGPGPLTLKASGAAAGDTYKWHNNVTSQDATGATYTTPDIFANQSNYASVRFLSSLGCEGSSVSTNILIEPLPVISCSVEPYIIHGNPITLTSTTGYTTYTWKNSAGQNVAQNVTQHSTSVVDSYTVTVTKTGITGEGVSAPFEVKSQLGAVNMNFIVESALSAEITDMNVVASLPIGVVNETIQYFDGLGRPLQSVITQGSPTKHDVIQTFIYDGFGREKYKFLPVTAEANGRYKNNIIDEASLAYTGVAANFYTPGASDLIAGDVKPYSESVFEISPFSRVVKQGSPGEAWQPNTDPADFSDKTIKKEYLFNGANDVVLWTYNTATHSISSGSGSTLAYYSINQLQATKTYDEHNNLTIEYADKAGRTVLKRVHVSGAQLPNDTNFASTYYVYDDTGNLVVVLPPEAVKELLIGRQ
jgi:hypothetical protein